MPCSIIEPREAWKETTIWDVIPYDAWPCEAASLIECPFCTKGTKLYEYETGSTLNLVLRCPACSKTRYFQIAK